MKEGATRLFALLIGLSFFVFVSATVLVVGLENTPFNAVDSHGRRIGFNDLLSFEHYRIIASNFHPRLLLEKEYQWDWLIFGAHLAGLLLLVFPRRRALQLFFGSQMVFAPISFFGGLILLIDIELALRGGLDRESFTDIPKWNLLVSLPFWVAASAVVFLALLEEPRNRGRSATISN